MKPLIAIGSMAFWGTSCFSASESKMAASNDFHPYWPELNESEEKLDADQCIVTKLGVGKFCFHSSNCQKSFNANDCYLKSQTNMVQSDEKALYWVLTPGYYGTLTEEKFPKTVSNMKDQCFSGDKEDGLPLSFLEEWLAIDTADCKEAILILSTGLKGQLGVSASLKEALENKKKKGAIKDYIIGTSKYAVRKHNEYVKAGNKVFTFISTAG